MGDERFRLGAVQAVADMRHEIGEGIVGLLDDACRALVGIPRDPDHTGGKGRGAAEQRLLLDHDHVETMQMRRQRRGKACRARPGHQHIAGHGALVHPLVHLALTSLVTIRLRAS